MTQKTSTATESRARASGAGEEKRGRYCKSSRVLVYSAHLGAGLSSLRAILEEFCGESKVSSEQFREEKKKKSLIIIVIQFLLSG